MAAVDTHGSSARGARQLGRYRLIARIAAGGMAEVYLAHQLGPMNFQKIVVVKVIHPHLGSQEEFIHMFLDEARVSALLKHHNVVDIYDLGVEGGDYFIAMEYIPGQALSRVISRSRTNRGLDVFTAVDIIADAANGLEAAHNLTDISGAPLELVHRDVSPGNILVSYAGAVKLVDFGVSKSLGQITVESTAQLKGKLGYASPEQLAEAPIDRRSDIFSLGVVLWESLALERLYRSGSAAATVKKILDGKPPPPSSRRPEVPAKLDRICLRALAVDPDDRYQSAAEMRTALLEVLREGKHFSDRKALAGFMSRTFAAEKAEHEQLIARLAEVKADDEVEDIEVELEVGLVADGDVPTPIEDMSSEIDLTADLEIVMEPDVVPMPPRAESRRAASSTVAPGRRRIQPRWVAIAGGAVALVALAAVLATQGSGGEAPAAAEPPALERAAVATEPAAESEPAPEPAPAEEPETEPAAQPEKNAATETEPEDETETETETASESEVVAPTATDPVAAAEARKQRARAYFRRGTQLFARGELGAAKARFRKALYHQPDYPAALRALGLAHARSNETALARRYLGRYLAVAPGARDAASIRNRLRALR